MNNTHLSLFSGIGGLDLAAEWAGFRTVAFVERDKYCQRVLAKHWPGVPIYSDVVEVTADAEGAGFLREKEPQDDGAHQGRWRGHDAADICEGVRLSLLSGGFPCQPHSVAGKRKASLDERDLWSECARITGEFKPRWAVFENVPGLLSSEGGTFFARVLGDLAALGYRVGWGVWGANDVGALHRRDRVFIAARRVLADPGRDGLQGRGAAGISERAGRDNEIWEAAGRGCNGARPGRSPWSAEPPVGRVAHGVPKRVDRLRALGNAVVPQQAYPIFKAIAEIEGITP